jgi:hypothetical protein
MRRILGFLFLSALLIPNSLYSQTDYRQQQSKTNSPLDIVISGPVLIRPGQSLIFKVTLINRSSAPVAIAGYIPGSVGDTFSWTISDSSGRELRRPEPKEFICGNGPPLLDDKLFVLQPGEKFEYKDAGDPSGMYVFAGKGNYRVTIRYQFAPPDSTRPLDKNDYQLHGDGAINPSKLEVLRRTPPINVTSNTWNMVLQ